MHQFLNNTPVLDATIRFDKMWPSTRLLFQKGLIPMFSWTAQLFPSHAHLAKETGLGTTQIKKCIKQAISLGVLENRT